LPASSFLHPNASLTTFYVAAAAAVVVALAVVVVIIYLFPLFTFLLNSPKPNYEVCTRKETNKGHNEYHDDSNHSISGITSTIMG
jgi:hypothetical protein